MAAIRQRRELLEQTQRAFSLRCKNFLSSKFLFHVSQIYNFYEIKINLYSIKSMAVNALN
jgi:hypothetical protein